jgi:hypothetical protein
MSRKSGYQMGLIRAVLRIVPQTAAHATLQSNGPVRYATVDGINVRDSRVHN